MSVDHINRSSLIMKQIQETFRGPVTVCTKLYKLLSSVKEIKPVTDVKEVLAGIKQYIFDKQLFDLKDPSKICCKDDDLALIFGVQEFTIVDVAKFLPKVLLPINSCGNSSGSNDLSKRKSDDIEETIMKKCRNETMVQYISPSPTSVNLSESADSFQGFESEKVDTDSDSYLSHEESDSHDNYSIVTVEETFDIEYEVESLDSFSSDSDSPWSDSDSEMDLLKSSIITVICKSDSDMEFWADKSSDDEYLGFDAEISDSDKWECPTCGDLNDPPCSVCLKCFQKRSEWFASGKRTQPKRKNRSKRKRAPKSHCFTKEDTSQSSQNDTCENKFPCTSSQESYSLEWAENTGTRHSDLNQDSDAKLCVLCFDRPRTGTIIHANSKYAHTVCCYTCAKKLQQQKERCPFCSRSIQQVVCSISS